jgi:PAS domain S-box-containing protein
MRAPPRQGPTMHRPAPSWCYDEQDPSRPWLARLGVHVAVIAGVAAAYFLAGKLGLRFAFIHQSVTAVWPPTGLALAAGLVLGYRVWPGVLLGAFLVNATTAGSIATSFGIACGNTLEGLLAISLTNRFAHGRAVLERAVDVFSLALWGALLSSTVGATVGVASLGLGGFIPWIDYIPVWVTWWLGDAMGVLIFTPLFLSWGNNPRWQPSPQQMLETLLALGLVGLNGLAVFAGLLPDRLQHQPLEFACLPLLIWIAFRCGTREAALAIVLLSGIAISSTLAGFGPFARETPHMSLLLLQAYLSVMALTTTVLAAAVSERQQVQEKLRRSERELTDFFEHAAVGLHWVGPDGRILRANQAELTLLGYSREEYVGRHIAEFHLDRLVIDDILQRLRNGETLQNYEARLRCRDGSIKDVLLDSNGLWENGRFVHSRCFTRDITDRKCAEEQVQASLREKEILLKEIHHRVKNNLQIISSLLDLQAETVTDPRAREVFEESQHHIRAMALIHESLYQSRDMAHLDAADYLGRLSKQLFEAYQTPDKCIRLVLELESVLMEPNQAIPCGLLLNELLSNCLKHAFPDGQVGDIRVSLRVHEDQISLSVHDTGVGFPEDLDFRQADSLGLQLVYLLSEQVGGTMTLEHTQGTTVTVTLPRHPPQA